MSILSVFTNRDDSQALPFDIRIAAFLFSSKRADYYRYLADMIEGTKGRLSLRDIFLGDADRYGSTARGKLSLHWANRFDEGGSLDHTFSGTLPKQDVAVMDTLQRQSAEGALEEGLRDLAANTGLIGSARTIILTTMAAALVCLGLVLALVIVMPAVTVPKIFDAFSMLPPSEYPEAAQGLLDFSVFIGEKWLWLTLAVTGFVVACIWSLSNLTGPVRLFFDRYLIIWGIARDFESIRFLSNLAAVLRKRGNTVYGLREAISMQLAGASRWRRHHVNRMLEIVDGGDSSIEIFQTGMLDRETSWYISDLIQARGLEDALQFVRDRLEGKVLARIRVQSVLLSWTLMMLALGGSGYLMFWHMIAIDDLRLALQQYLS